MLECMRVSVTAQGGASLGGNRVDASICTLGGFGTFGLAILLLNFLISLFNSTNVRFVINMPILSY